MYRDVSEVLFALQTGKTTVKTCRNTLCNYRKEVKVENVLMFLTAIELFKYYKDPEKTPMKYR